jgi:hypothetical protein
MTSEPRMKEVLVFVSVRAIVEGVILIKRT